MRRRFRDALDEALEGLLVPEGIVCMEKAHAKTGRDGDGATWTKLGWAS